MFAIALRLVWLSIGLPWFIIGAVRQQWLIKKYPRRIALLAAAPSAAANGLAAPVVYLDYGRTRYQRR